MIGVPTHLVINGVSVCGIVSPRFGTPIAKITDCVRCHRTHKFSEVFARHKRDGLNIILIPGGEV